eukprot:m.243373 g.243373  ORF g.243373 m.243373 type:complete len:71 (-) comp19448_c0_seq7:380-592(-)
MAQVDELQYVRGLLLKHQKTALSAAQISLHIRWMIQRKDQTLNNYGDFTAKWLSVVYPSMICAENCVNIC